MRITTHNILLALVGEPTPQSSTEVQRFLYNSFPGPFYYRDVVSALGREKRKGNVAEPEKGFFHLTKKGRELIDPNAREAKQNATHFRHTPNDRNVLCGLRVATNAEFAKKANGVALGVTIYPDNITCETCRKVLHRQTYGR